MKKENNDDMPAGCPAIRYSSIQPRDIQTTKKKKTNKTLYAKNTNHTVTTTTTHNQPGSQSGERNMGW